MDIEIIFNFESPQTEILGNFCMVSGCRFITINLTSHTLLFGFSENNLIDAITSTINHEILHNLMMDECRYRNQEYICKVIDHQLFPLLSLNHSNIISKERRYKIEALAGYG